MLSDMIDDLVRADCPQEKEAAYRQLEKLGVDRITADVIAAPKGGAPVSRYIPPEEMNEAQIRKQLDAEYKHWDDLKKNGCSDPAWPDGVNLNLVRNHIIYWYRLLRERTNQTVQLSMFDAGMDLRNERPLPPEVPDRYMVPTGKYPDRLNGKWDGLIFDPTI